MLLFLHPIIRTILVAKKGGFPQDEENHPLHKLKNKTFFLFHSDFLWWFSLEPREAIPWRAFQVDTFLQRSCGPILPKPQLAAGTPFLEKKQGRTWLMTRHFLFFFGKVASTWWNAKGWKAPGYRQWMMKDTKVFLVRPLCNKADTSDNLGVCGAISQSSPILEFTLFYIHNAGLEI